MLWIAKSFGLYTLDFPFSIQTRFPTNGAEFLLADISDLGRCATVLPIDAGWSDPAQEEMLRWKYEGLLDQLRKWQGADSQLIHFEEVQLDYPHETKFPLEFGLPLLCVAPPIFALY